MSFHINTHSKATVGVKLHEYKNPYGVVNINKDGDIKKIIELESNDKYLNNFFS